MTQNTTAEINRTTRLVIVLVIVIHMMFFILEAIFWMQPFVHNLLLDFLSNPVTLSYPQQALVLKKLFINQGFYNLFLVAGGIAGLYQIAKGSKVAGYVVLLFVCFSATGAGIVLACTTKAYLLACFQAIPASIAFVKIYPLYRFTTGK